MKFTIVSHACMYVEHENTKLLIDPWIVGSCYWRSWWNFPEPSEELRQRLKPTSIYITHLHWDHFHGPSLRLFPKETKIYVPLATTHRMVHDLKQVGFRNVEEVPHGSTVQLGDGLRLSSYQSGPTLDSAAVITDGQTTLLNTNDSKFFGAPLRELLAHTGRPDFVFRSHSNAGPIPHCVEDYDKQFPPYRGPADYVQDFIRFSAGTEARYAVPFASNHCYLHQDTIRFNDVVTTPDMVEHAFIQERAKRGFVTECKVMPPGSSWDDVNGFDIKPFDYADRERFIATMSEEKRPHLEKQYSREAKARPNWRAFERYFLKLFEDVPSFLRRALAPHVVFEVSDPEGVLHWWHVDFAKGEVSERGGVEDADFMIRTPAIVLNDLTRKRMFSAWTPSKRLTIKVLADRTLGSANRFFLLMDLYEQDAFPLKNNLDPRVLKIVVTRWREGVEFVRLLTRHKVLRRPFNPTELYPWPQ